MKQILILGIEAAKSHLQFFQFVQCVKVDRTDRIDLPPEGLDLRIDLLTFTSLLLRQFHIDRGDVDAVIITESFRHGGTFKIQLRQLQLDPMQFALKLMLAAATFFDLLARFASLTLATSPLDLSGFCLTRTLFQLQVKTGQGRRRLKLTKVSLTQSIFQSAKLILQIINGHFSLSKITASFRRSSLRI